MCILDASLGLCEDSVIHGLLSFEGTITIGKRPCEKKEPVCIVDALS